MSEELNWKYHELCGWKIEPFENYGYDLIAPDGKRPLGRAFPMREVLARMPKLHLDANLAIAEAVKVLGSGFDVRFFADGAAQLGKGDYCTGEHAFCEAILKALIDAKHRQEVG